MDFDRPVLGRMYLIVVDDFSKWLDVVPMSQSTLHLQLSPSGHYLQLMGCLRFAAYFKSEEFVTFMLSNNIVHITSAPYHATTNGLAERGVQTVKHSLR